MGGPCVKSGPSYLCGELRHPPGQNNQDPGLAVNGGQVPQRAGRPLQGGMSSAVLRDCGMRRYRLRAEGGTSRGGQNCARGARSSLSTVDENSSLLSGTISLTIHKNL